MVAFGYKSTSTHLPPLAVKVEQVRQTFSALQVVSTDLQKPSLDSALQARYGLHVSKATPAPVLSPMVLIQP